MSEYSSSIVLDLESVATALKKTQESMSEFNSFCNSFSNTVETKLTTPINKSVNAMIKAIEYIDGLGAKMGNTVKSIAAARNELFKEQGANGDTGIKQLREIVSALTSLGSLNTKDFSTLSTSIHNLSSGLTRLSKVDLKSVITSVRDLKELSDKIVIKDGVSSTADSSSSGLVGSLFGKLSSIGKGDSGNDTIVFSQKALNNAKIVGDSFEKLSKALISLGNVVNKAKSIAETSSITSGSVISVLRVAINDMFNSFGALFEADTVATEKDGVSSNKFVERVTSKTLAVKQVSTVLSSFIKTILNIKNNVYGSVNKVTETLATLRGSVNDLFVAFSDLFSAQDFQVTKDNKNISVVVELAKSKALAVKRIANAVTSLVKAVDPIAKTDFNDVRGKIDTFRDAVKDIFDKIGSLGKLDGDSKGGASFANANVNGFKKMADAMSVFAKSISGLSANMPSFQSKTSGASSALNSFILSLSTITEKPYFAAFERLARAMDKVSNASKNIISSTDKVIAGMDRAGDAASGASNKFSLFSGKIRQIYTAFVGGTVIYSFVRSIKDAIKATTDLELAMARVNTIARVSKTELAAMTEEVIQMTAKYGIAQDVMSYALYEINSATITGKDAMAVLEASSMAAVAGFTDVNKVAELLSKTINAYGYEAKDASKLADILFVTVERGINTMDELSQYMGRLLTVSANAGVSFESINAAIATLTSRGLQTNIAVTALNSAILKLSQGNQHLNKLFSEQGYVSSAVALRHLGLAKTMDILRKATKGQTDALTKLGFNYRDIRAVSTLASGSLEEFYNNLERVNKASDGAGATQKALSKVQETLAYRVSVLKARWSELIQTIYDTINASKVLKDILDGLLYAIEGIIKALKGESVDPAQHIINTALKVGLVVVAILAAVKGGKTLVAVFKNLSNISKTLSNSLNFSKGISGAKTAATAASKSTSVAKTASAAAGVTKAGASGAASTFGSDIIKLTQGYQSAVSGVKISKPMPLPKDAFNIVNTASKVKGADSTFKGVGASISATLKPLSDFFNRLTRIIKVLPKLGKWGKVLSVVFKGLGPVFRLAFGPILTIVLPAIKSLQTISEIGTYIKQGATSSASVWKSIGDGAMAMVGLKGWDAFKQFGKNAIAQLPIFDLFMKDEVAETEAGGQNARFIHYDKGELQAQNIRQNLDKNVFPVIKSRQKNIGVGLDELKTMLSKGLTPDDVQFKNVEGAIRSQLDDLSNAFKNPRHAKVISNYVERIKKKLSELKSPESLDKFKEEITNASFIKEFGEFNEKRTEKTQTPYEALADAQNKLQDISKSSDLKVFDLSLINNPAKFQQHLVDLAEQGKLTKGARASLTKYANALKEVDGATKKADAAMTAQQKTMEGLFIKPLTHFGRFKKAQDSITKQSKEMFGGKTFGSIFDEYKKHIQGGGTAQAFYKKMSTQFKDPKSVTKLKEAIDKRLSDEKLKQPYINQLQSVEMNLSGFIDKSKLDSMSDIMKVDELKKKLYGANGIFSSLKKGFAAGAVDPKQLELYQNYAKQLYNLAGQVTNVKVPTSITSMEGVKAGSKEAYDMIAKQVFADRNKPQKEAVSLQKKILKDSNDIVRLLRNDLKNKGADVVTAS